MPRVSFTQEVGPAKSGVNFPKLKLEKDESARIVCLEEPVMAYVHTLEKPKILNGKPVIVEKERFKDKSKYTVNAMDFVSAFLCLGDEDIMDERGVDPDNCPACFASTRSDEVKPPRRRYAMNVIRYATKPGETEVKTPFNVDVEAWVFSDQQFNKLRKLAVEGWDLQTHDLLLGPCTDPGFQKFEVVISMSAAWMATEENKKRTLEVFKENKASVEDLEALCARRTERKWIDQDLDAVHDRWLELSGVSGPVDKLLQKTETPTVSSTIFDTENTVTVPAQDVTSASSTSADIVLDFDELMKGL